MTSTCFDFGLPPNLGALIRHVAHSDVMYWVDAASMDEDGIIALRKTPIDMPCRRSDEAVEYAVWESGTHADAVKLMNRMRAKCDALNGRALR